MKKLNSIMIIDEDGLSNCINENLIRSMGIASVVTSFTIIENALAFLKTIDKNLEYVESITPEFVLLDINMFEKHNQYFYSEFETLTESLKSKINIIILSSFREDQFKALAYKRVSTVLLKPLSEKSVKMLPDVSSVSFIRNN